MPMMVDPEEVSITKEVKPDLDMVKEEEEDDKPEETPPEIVEQDEPTVVVEKEDSIKEEAKEIQLLLQEQTSP